MNRWTRQALPPIVQKGAGAHLLDHGRGHEGVGVGEQVSAVPSKTPLLGEGGNTEFGLMTGVTSMATRNAALRDWGPTCSNSPTRLPTGLVCGSRRTDTDSLASPTTRS